MLAFLGPIVDRIREEFNVGADQLVVECDSYLLKKVDPSFLEDSFGKMDMVVQYHNSIQLTHLVVVESKTIDADSYQHLMLNLLRAYDLNDEKLPLYGFCTNAVDWNVIKYDGQEFSMLFKRTVMFPQMDKRDERLNDLGQTEKNDFKYRQYWLDKGYSEMVGIIYSCLRVQMTNAKELWKRKEQLTRFCLARRRIREEEKKAQFQC